MMTQKFNHIALPTSQEITQVNIDGKRYYDTPEGTFPSITNVLSTGPTPDWLVKWRTKPEAPYIMRMAIMRGSKFHEMVATHLNNQRLGPITDYGLLAYSLFDLAQPVFDNISNIRGIELPLYNSKWQVAGTADTICNYSDVPSIVDWKTTRKIYDDVNSNFWLQSSFYAYSFTQMYGIPIKQVVIVQVSEEGELKISKDNPKNHLQELENVIQVYKSSNGHQPGVH